MHTIFVGNYLTNMNKIGMRKYNKYINYSFNNKIKHDKTRYHNLIIYYGLTKMECNYEKSMYK